MTAFQLAFRGIKAVALLAGTALLCGFTFRDGGPPELHYADYNNAKPPRGNTVTVCHGHGCQNQESFTFSQDDIADLEVLMNYARNSDTPQQERRAIAYAIGWIERRVGPKTGTANDEASLGFMNDSGQLDCVDEATNATSYLLVLQRNGLLRHHVVVRPFSKASFFQWPHMAAMIKTRQSNQIYAVDSGVGPNGTNPAITLASKWYIDESVPEATPVPPRLMAKLPAKQQSPAHDNGDLAHGVDDIGILVERVLRNRELLRSSPYLARNSVVRFR
jgi:hypothetical protein